MNNINDDDVIIGARITAGPKSLMDFNMPTVYVTTAAGEVKLFEYYPDELSFTPAEFLGLTVTQARRLKFTKDVAFLKGDA